MTGEPPRRGRRVMLRDRGQECEALDGLLADVQGRAQPGAAIRGEPGIGKTITGAEYT
jgi:hypothetical protein